MRRSTENFKAYTDRAVEASLNETMIPPLVYIPAKLRKSKVRIVETLTTKPPTFEENTIRVEQADPTGFLIALMQGQPLPVFEIKEAGGKMSVEVGWKIPDLPLRAEVAMELQRRVARGKKVHADGYEAMINKAAEDDLITKS